MKRITAVTAFVCIIASLLVAPTVADTTSIAIAPSNIDITINNSSSISQDFTVLYYTGELQIEPIGIPVAVSPSTDTVTNTHRIITVDIQPQQADPGDYDGYIRFTTTPKAGDTPLSISISVRVKVANTVAPPTPTPTPTTPSSDGSSSGGGITPPVTTTAPPTTTPGLTTIAPEPTQEPPETTEPAKTKTTSEPTKITKEPPTTTTRTTEASAPSTVSTEPLPTVIEALQDIGDDDSRISAGTILFIVGVTILIIIIFLVWQKRSHYKEEEEDQF